MAAVSFNPLSTETTFLKNKSDPAVNKSNIGDATVTRTINHNGPNRPNGFKRGTYSTANNAPSSYKRIGRSAENTMAIRNETRRRNRLDENEFIKLFPSEFNNVHMPRAKPRNQSEAGAYADLLHEQLENEALNVAPNLTENQRNYHLTREFPKPAKSALHKSRNASEANENWYNFNNSNKFGGSKKNKKKNRKTKRRIRR